MNAENPSSFEFDALPGDVKSTNDPAKQPNPTSAPADSIETSSRQRKPRSKPRSTAPTKRPKRRARKRAATISKSVDNLPIRRCGPKAKNDRTIQLIAAINALHALDKRDLKYILELFAP